MKYLAFVLTLSIFLSFGLVADAAKDGKKGPSDRAHERANENAAFKRDKDWAPGEHKDKKKKKHRHHDEDGEHEDGDRHHKGKHKNKHKYEDHDDRDHHGDDHDDHEHPDDDHTDDLSEEELLNEAE